MNKDVYFRQLKSSLGLLVWLNPVLGRGFLCPKTNHVT